MKFAKVTSLLAGSLFVAGGVGAVGVWAISVSCVLLLTAAVVAAVAMERPDFTDVDGLVPSASDQALEPQANAGEEPALTAAA